MQQVCILGSTGSIGVSTLDVIARHPDRYAVHTLSAHSSCEQLLQQCLQFRPKKVVMADERAGERLKGLLAQNGLITEVAVGAEALIAAAGHPETPVVMAAIVGAAGLLPTLEAVKAGKKVLLANKEALVTAGALFMDEVRKHQAQLLPIDSEHNAIFQCLPYSSSQVAPLTGVRKLLLTGSGGPFLTTPLEQLAQVTPEQAVAHPNWSMGRKISVDSATMMNKGLEFIEACWLFGVKPERIDIVLHPQSIIHSMVSYEDGSVLAQMGQPDMRTPIAHALAWPERIASGVEALDLTAMSGLTFLPPDFHRYPCLQLAIKAFEFGGTAPALLNAANEVAVDAFLNERIRFTDIASVIERTVHSARQPQAPQSIQQVIDIDAEGRGIAGELIAEFAL